MALRSESCGNSGSSPSRSRTQDSDRTSYTTGFEPQGIRKSRGNQRNSRTQQPNLPFNNSAATQNRSSNSGASSSSVGHNTGTRRRIPVAVSHKYTKSDLESDTIL